MLYLELGTQIDDEVDDHVADEDRDVSNGKAEDVEGQVKGEED